VAEKKLSTEELSVLFASTRFASPMLPPDSRWRTMWEHSAAPPEGRDLAFCIDCIAGEGNPESACEHGWCGKIARTFVSNVEAFPGPEPCVGIRSIDNDSSTWAMPKESTTDTTMV